MKRGAFLLVVCLLLLVPAVAWAPPPGTPVTVPIDADTLDGLDSVDFALSVHNHNFSEISGPIDADTLDSFDSADFVLSSGDDISGSASLFQDGWFNALLNISNSYDGSATYDGQLFYGGLAVYGEAAVAQGYGVGGFFEGGMGGVVGMSDWSMLPASGLAEEHFGVNGYVQGGSTAVGVRADAEDATYNYALRAEADGGTQENYGGYFRADSDGIFNYAVYAHTRGTATNNYAIIAHDETGSGYAGYFVGDVHVQGNFSKSTGTFKIDHPLDPKNKYLYHSMVESPDMMNIYNGMVTLNEEGKAVVQMPDYFEALNRDFRYQLTAIGASAPELYVAEEISDNQFQIAGGKPFMKVSWEVTGIRKDPYAQVNPVVVEVEKPDHEKGTYLNPVAYSVQEPAAPRLSLR